MAAAGIERDGGRPPQVEPSPEPALSPAGTGWTGVAVDAGVAFDATPEVTNANDFAARHVLQQGKAPGKAKPPSPSCYIQCQACGRGNRTADECLFLDLGVVPTRGYTANIGYGKGKWGKTKIEMEWH